MVPKVRLAPPLIRTRVLRAVSVAVLAVFPLLQRGQAHADPAEAKKIFTTRCTACHTFGKGVKVGPDLKGVTERRQRPWLLAFIRSSSTVIAAGDPIASGLFAEFKQQRMPDWTDLSEAQITSILDWLAANGPEQRDADARAAESATAAERATGRGLFHGTTAFASGGIGCASCHSIRDEGGNPQGGTLAGDLTNIYSLYQDGGMTQFLRHPCFQRFPESTLTPFLAPTESFALKAYLRETALQQAPSAAPRSVSVTGRSVAKSDEDTGEADPAGGPAAATTAGGSAGPARRVAWTPRTTTSPGARDAAPVIRPLAPPERSTVLFEIFPYAALLILIVGLGIRHALARRRPDAIRPAAAEAWRRIRGSRAWRIGLAATALGHVLALALPGSVQAWNGVPVRLYLLEGSGFALGVVALIGLVQTLVRDPGRTPEASGGGATRLPEIADHALLSLACVALVSGLLTAVLYRWGSSWALSTLVPYMRSLARGAPASELVEQMPFLVRLHVFTWFAMLAVLPLTRVAAILVAAGDRALLAAARPLGAIARTGRRALARLSPARWLWPDEDAVEPEPRNAQEPS